MAEEKEKSERDHASEEETSIEKLLREREKLDAQLKDKFSQNVTVMFTDIKGSTTFFETYGDIEGRLMVQKHNEMLFPIITSSSGRVIKTIGDAIMAAFEAPEGAVRAAIGMQQQLLEYNRSKKDKKDQIHIRIGINTGEGLVEKSDIYGDVVNVAARVESLTEPDDILVSGPVYEHVRKTDDIICRYASQTKVKGKEEPIEVYRVVWGEEEAVGGLTRSAAAAQRVSRRRRELTRRLEIDISREAETLRITASEKTDKGGSTIRPYEEMRISLSQIEALCQEVIGLLNRANTRGKVSKDILAKLRDVGQVLFDNLLSAKAKETLRSSSVNDLVFYIEDTLVQIPWELLYDGEQFLCQKFNMGRIVKTKREVFNIKQRMLSRPLKMLIVSDPRGDLENSFKEGQIIREQMDSNASFISANQRSGQISAAYIKEKIRNFDMVHYAGHADYDTEDPSNSGWLLEGGKFTSADIVKLIGGKPMPSLVFSNACQSGQTEEWKLGEGYNQKIFGLANAFLLAGVQHYVGTFWEILDEPGARFAEEFYRAMMEGASIGEAMRQARAFLIKEYGEDTIVWASYLLYGDPGFNYFDFADEAEDEAAEPAGRHQELREAAQLRSTSGETVSFDRAAAAPSNTKVMAIAVAAVVVLAVAFVFFFTRQGKEGGTDDPYVQAYTLLHQGKITDARRSFEALPQDDPRRFEGIAAVFYELGDTKTSLEMAGKTLEAAPYNMYAAVIRGHVLFSQGKLDEALKEYSAAADRKGGARWQKAEAYNGIARIYSSRGDMQKAAEYYAKAAESNPASSEIFTNQAFAMQRMGNAAGAMDSFQKAVQANQQDSFASVMLADAMKKKKAQDDAARSERIDKLVGELVSSFKAGGAAKAPADDWTSKPATISFINIASKGAPAEREGEDDYFMLKVSSMLQDSGRVQIVERELLDKLLEELKLSSTALVDQNTSLTLGRILAARVIATGTIMRYNQDIQVSIRLTDTETTSLKGAVTESAKDIEKLAESVTQKMLDKIKKGYPIRGAVQSLEGAQVVLSFGPGAGVQDGMEFKVLQEVKREKGFPPLYRPVGSVTIASVSGDSAFATVRDQAEQFKPGFKVEQIVR